MRQKIRYDQIGRILLALLGIALLGCSFLRYCSPNYYSAFLYMYIFPIGILAGGCLIRNGELYREKSFLILGLFYLWYLIAVFLNEKIVHSPGENWKFVLVAAVQVFLLFPIGFISARKKRGQNAFLYAWISVGIITVLSAWGIYQCLCGRTFMPAFENRYGIGIFVGRLAILANPNPTGLVCCISAVLAGFLFCTQKSRSMRILAAVCGVICYTATALTASKTALLAVGAGLGGITFRRCYLAEYQKKQQKRILRPLLLAVAVASACFLMYKPIVQIAGMNTHALADRAYLDSENPLTGRSDIWKIGLEQMNATARSWLIGFSPNRIGEQIGEKVFQVQKFWTNELHNSYLQVLMSCGLPGLLLLFVFLASVLKSCLSAMMHGDGEEWSGYLAGIVFAVMTMAIAETFFFSYDQMHFVNFWFFASAGTLCGTESSRVRATVLSPASVYAPTGKWAGAYALQLGTFLREPMDK